MEDYGEQETPNLHKLGVSQPFGRHQHQELRVHVCRSGLQVGDRVLHRQNELCLLVFRQQKY